MKRIAVLLLAVPLAGCFTDQVKRVASCQLEAQQMYMRETDSSDAATAAASTADVNLATVTCMQAHGYAFTGYPEIAHDKRCAVFKDDIRVINATNPWCYRPMGWGGRQVLNFEVLMGR
jgi:hypothetical protein